MNPVLIGFAIIGILCSSNAIHEGVHVMQLKGDVNEVCFAGYSDGAVGWVQPNGKIDNLFQLEAWAYSIQFLFLFLMSIIILKKTKVVKNVRKK